MFRRKLPLANPGEMAIRVLRAASGMSIRTVVVCSTEDRFARRRCKADEPYLVSAGES